MVCEIYFSEHFANSINVGPKIKCRSFVLRALNAENKYDFIVKIIK